MNNPPPVRTRRIAWVPLVINFLGLAAITTVLVWPDLERNLTRWFLSAIALLVLAVNLLWFVLTPRFSRRVRWSGLAVALLLIGAAKLLVKVNGTMDGTGLPRLAWKWSGNRVALNTPPPATAPIPASSDPRLAQAADVPQFFGPGRDGTVTGARLFRDWKERPPKELWRQPIGEGWSAFAVVQGRAYTQEQRGADELVSCYDLFTGTLLWAVAHPARFSQWQSGDGPHATPAVADGRVYAYGGTGVLQAIDAATGQSLWQRSVLTENNQANLEWGISASPLLVDDLVVVTGGNTEGPVLFAWQKATGAPVWQAGQDRATYASPILTTLAGRRVILANHARALTVHDPATGAVLAAHAWGNAKWPKASQPVVVGSDRVFVSAGYGMGCLMVEFKPAPDGKFLTEEVWSGLKLKTQFNSPALRGGYLYGLDDGRLACLDAATGSRLWKEGRFASGQSLLVDDQVVVQHEGGDVSLLGADPGGFKDYGTIAALSSKTWNHPVLAGRYLLLRNDREAVCYELPVNPPKVAKPNGLDRSGGGF